MDTIIGVKNKIRDFLRKYDEIISPIVRFGCCLAIFICINSMFGYFDLTRKFSFVFLLAVITALLPDGFLVFITGIVIAINCLSCSIELGAAYFVLFIVMYCIYIRFFPEYSYAMFLAMICCVLRVPYVAPIVIGVTAGVGGAIPGAFGIITYYFSKYVADMNKLVASAKQGEKTDVLSGFVSNFVKNKEMMLAAVIIIVVVMVVGLIYKLSFNYSWYVAIGSGVFAAIVSSLFGGLVLSTNAPMVPVLVGSLIGAIAALIVQFCKDIVDYSKTERVQYEDDDYYYYVKAIPKVKTRAEIKSKKAELKKKAKEDAED